MPLSLNPEVRRSGNSGPRILLTGLISRRIRLRRDFLMLPPLFLLALTLLVRRALACLMPPLVTKRLILPEARRNGNNGLKIKSIGKTSRLMLPTRESPMPLLFLELASTLPVPRVLVCLIYLLVTKRPVIPEARRNGKRGLKISSIGKTSRLMLPTREFLMPLPFFRLNPSLILPVPRAPACPMPPLATNLSLRPEARRNGRVGLKTLSIGKTSRPMLPTRESPTPPPFFRPKPSLISLAPRALAFQIYPPVMLLLLRLEARKSGRIGLRTSSIGKTSRPILPTRESLTRPLSSRLVTISTTLKLWSSVFP